MRISLIDLKMRRNAPIRLLTAIYYLYNSYLFIYVFLVLQAVYLYIDLLFYRIVLE